jgi:hypothetical protein
MSKIAGRDLLELILEVMLVDTPCKVANEKTSHLFLKNRIDYYVVLES